MIGLLVDSFALISRKFSQLVDFELLEVAANHVGGIK